MRLNTKKNGNSTSSANAKLVNKISFEKYPQIEVFVEKTEIKGYDKDSNYPRVSVDKFGRKKYCYVVKEKKSLSKEMKDSGHVYEKDGYTWVSSTMPVNENGLLQFGRQKYTYKNSEGVIVTDYTPEKKFFAVKQELTQEQLDQKAAEKHAEWLGKIKQQLADLDALKDVLTKDEYAKMRMEIMKQIAKK